MLAGAVALEDLAFVCTIAVDGSRDRYMYREGKMREKGGKKYNSWHAPVAVRAVLACTRALGAHGRADAEHS